ncbi:unnamed protein product [Gordionus sp. m RMFG-2023]
MSEIENNNANNVLDKSYRNHNPKILWGPNFYIDSVIVYLQYSWRRKIRPAKFIECLLEYFEEAKEAQVKTRLEEHRFIIYPENPETRNPNRSCILSHMDNSCRINLLKEPAKQFTCKWGIEVVLSVMLYTRDEYLLVVRTSSKNTLFPDCWNLPSQKLPIGIAIREAGFQILLYMIGYYNDWPTCDTWITCLWEAVDVKENLDAIGKGNHFLNIFLVIKIPIAHQDITRESNLNMQEVTICSWFSKKFLETLINNESDITDISQPPKSIEGIITKLDGTKQEFLIKPSVFLDDRKKGKDEKKAKFTQSFFYAINKMLSDIYRPQSVSQ